jgi:hypothetical protein
MAADSDVQKSDNHNIKVRERFLEPRDFLIIVTLSFPNKRHT